MTNGAMILNNREMPYPRVCAHRGYSAVAPENSIPAYEAAVALGVEEIEMDIWATRDGVLVSAHDEELENLSDGTGLISDHTLAELKKLDFGVRFSEEFRGLRIPTFEEILERFAKRVIMNVHMKVWKRDPEKDYIKETVALIRKYDCQDYVYFMSANGPMVRTAKEYAPDIQGCIGWDRNPDPLSMVRRAMKFGIDRIQLFTPNFTEETVRLAHENGILCNVFFADEPEKARAFLDMGIDVILTNHCERIQKVVEEKKAETGTYVLPKGYQK